ncbi:MAG: RluA family pseudouridine synthase [Erysipelotrichaceae bacterium]|nr:RluA family pseudouridine synthase [Erysipelotrichaceae bacterium]
MKFISDEKIRIDKYLIQKLEFSRSKIQRLIDSNHILVNNKPTKNNYILHLNDEITVQEDDTEKLDIQPEAIPLDIYYEDDYLLVVNKPSGMVVHPAPGNHEKTLVNALMHHCNNKLSGINGEIRPGIVHRIDKDTSGLLLVAKTDEVHNDLANQISKKTVTRKYLALVEGTIHEDTATIDAPIGRDLNNRKKMAVTNINSKNAITHLKILERYPKATLIECRLETGRTHQIRVHLNYIGHPVINDPVYGHKKLDDKEFGQMLHAKTLGFIHPVTKKYLEFSAEPPAKFQEILEKYKNEV